MCLSSSRLLDESKSESMHGWEQASADMSPATSVEALEVLARVREALPPLREASDVGIVSQHSENLDAMASASRSFDGEAPKTLTNSCIRAFLCPLYHAEPLTKIFYPAMRLDRQANMSHAVVRHFKEG